MSEGVTLAFQEEVSVIGETFERAQSLAEKNPLVTEEEYLNYMREIHAVNLRFIAAIEAKGASND